MLVRERVAPTNREATKLSTNAGKRLERQDTKVDYDDTKRHCRLNRFAEQHKCLQHDVKPSEQCKPPLTWGPASLVAMNQAKAAERLDFKVTPATNDSVVESSTTAVSEDYIESTEDNVESKAAELKDNAESKAAELNAESKAAELEDNAEVGEDEEDDCSGSGGDACDSGAVSRLSSATRDVRNFSLLAQRALTVHRACERAITLADQYERDRRNTLHVIQQALARLEHHNY